MAKKLLLVNPVQQSKLNLASIPMLRVPPIGLAYVAALTPPDWNVKIVDESVQRPSFEPADLVGITAFTCNAPRAYEVSETYRQQGVPTVMGGVHASVLPEEAMGFVDSVVVGEAESVWPRVIHYFERK